MKYRFIYLFSYNDIYLWKRKLKKNDKLYFNIFFFYLKNFLPENSNYKDLILINLLIIDFCCIYKTYRHIFGLPVKGQRTWSNGFSSKNNNILLRQYKLKKFSNFIINYQPYDSKRIFIAEYVNFFWRQQNYLEWLSVKKKNLNIYGDKKLRTKIDFLKCSRGNIEHFFQKFIDLKKKKSHRKKRVFSKNSITIGWDFGYSKEYLEKLRKLNHLERKKLMLR